MLALKAGALTVLAIPSANWAPNSAHSGASRHTRTASTIDSVIIVVCMAITSRVRLRRSASMPAGIESNNSGPS